MELWFWFAVAGAILGGVPSFLMKVAAHRQYNPALFVLYGAVSSAAIFVPVAFVVSGTKVENVWFMLMAGIGGVVAALAGILRIHALRHIDTTIYYPLVKLLSPALAIVFGIVLFSESFNSTEWVGLIMGLLVPFLLISRAENKRQNNLVQGLLLVLLGAVISAMVAALYKYATNYSEDVPWLLAFSAVGVLIGSILFLLYKQGLSQIVRHIIHDTSKNLMIWAFFRGFVIAVSFGAILYAYAFGGTLAVVHTIHSLYILIPIVLSIIFYGEHWNMQKVIAIVLSVAALALLG